MVKQKNKSLRWKVKSRYYSKEEAQSDAYQTRACGVRAKIKSVGKHTFDYYVLTLQ